MPSTIKIHRFINIILVLALLSTLVPAPLWAQPVAGSPGLDAVDGAAATSDRALPANPAATGIDAPLALTRAQSTYQAGGTLVVTYTVRSTVGPALRPALAPTATVTETAEAVAAVDYTNDPNRVRDVLLSLTLTDPAAALIDSSRPVAQSGDTLLVNLGDVLPLGEQSVSLTLTGPATAADFTTLDGGAAAAGNWRGRPVTANAGPIALAPDGFTAYLTCPIDADCQDPYVLEQAAALDNDPTALFAFVRGLTYEAYDGSLRGARGTLWSAGGNGIDQASLLIALLRASGIPAAYHRGTLAPAETATLIASMFPDRPVLGGTIPADAAVADPVGSPELNAEAADHAWVEAYLPGSGWTMLDPSFPMALPGDSFTASASGRLSELPDALRHKVTVSLEVEKYSQFPVNGTGLYREYPLSAEFSAVELIGEPIIFAHLVDSNSPPGLIFGTVDNTYTPYFIVGRDERLIPGDPIQDLLTTFPFGTNFVLAEWLTFTITDPDGNSESYQRELFDDLGYAARVNQGYVGNIERDNTPRLDESSSWSTLFAPSGVPLSAVDRVYQEAALPAQAAQAALNEVNALIDAGGPNPEDQPTLEAAVVALGTAVRVGQRATLLQFAAGLDVNNAFIEDSTRVEIYADAPRIFTIGYERNPGTGATTVDFDMARNTLRTVAHPGQTLDGVRIANTARNVTEIGLEQELIKTAAPAPVTSVLTVFEKAKADGIPFERFTAGNLFRLDELALSDEAKARISVAITENPALIVLVPAQMVTLDGATEPTVGWLEVNAVTGEVRDTMEDGRHLAAIEYASLLDSSLQELGFAIAGFGQGFFAYTMGFLAEFFAQVPISDLDAALAAAKAAGSDLANSIKDSLPDGGEGDVGAWINAFKEGVETLNITISVPGYDATVIDLPNIGGFCNGIAAAETIISANDPPIPTGYYDPPVPAIVPVSQATTVIAPAATLPAGPVNATVTSDLVGAVDGIAAYTTVATTTYAFDTLDNPTATVRQAGAPLGSGVVAATDGVAAAASGIDVSRTFTGTASFHAVLSGALAEGTRFDSYAATLTDAAGYTLNLFDTALTLDGAPYSGDFALESSAASTVRGAGSTAAATLAADVSLTTGGLTAAGGSGTLTVGGVPVTPAEGFALGNPAAAATVDGSGQLTYSGAADFFSLDLQTTGPTAWLAQIDANYSDSYTLTLFAPAGWSATLDASGNAGVTPPPGVAGTFDVLVTAQSAAYPDLFVSAARPVTIAPVDAVAVAIEQDPEYTVPLGEIDPDLLDYSTNDGRAQLSDAAYLITITNTSTIDRVYDVAVAGLPAGWTIFGAVDGNTSLSLPLDAGETRRLALYIDPDPLPPVGADYPFDVTATAQDDGAVTDTANAVLTIAGDPFPLLRVAPAEMTVVAGSATPFTATMTNIGNAPATFDWGSRVPVDAWSVSSPASPVMLQPGESVTASLTLTVTSGLPGLDHPVQVFAAAPTLPYTPTTAIVVYVLSAAGGPISDAGNELAVCAADATLVALYDTLALAMSGLEAGCNSGSCSPADRDAVVNAAQALVDRVNARTPALDTSAVAADIDALAAASDDAAIEAALTALSASVSALAEPLCAVAASQPALSWSPTYNAALTGSTVTYTLDLTNQGTVTSTYALTVSLPVGPVIEAPTLAPGASVAYTYPLSGTAPGYVSVNATAVASQTALSRATASAALNVVDRFVQVTVVTPNPDFVETGISATDISADIRNYAGLPLATTARVEALAPGGGVQASAAVPLTLIASADTYALNTFDTSGWAKGVYTVTVDLRDGDDVPLPDGFGYGLLVVGEGIKAIQSVTPQIVVPGTVTVSTAITTVLTQQSFGGTQPVTPTWEPMGWRGLPEGYIATVAGEDGTETVRRGPDPAPAPDPVDRSADPIDRAPAAEDGFVEAQPMPMAETPPTADDEPLVDPLAQRRSGAIAAAGTLTRTEETGFTYTGAVSAFSSDYASGGAYTRLDAVGDTATITVTASWIGLGFASGTASGIAEIYVDGALFDTVDLYDRVTFSRALYYDFGVSATRVISIAATDTRNPFSSNDRVNIDFIDTYDGVPLPDGSFEEDDARVWLGAGWSNRTSPVASNGTYLRATGAGAWFPFSGDSVTYQALATSSGGRVLLSIDGEYVTTLDLFSYETVTRTISFDGLGAGPHVLHIQSYRGTYEYIDRFVQPGVGPFFDPAPTGEVRRVEEDALDILYNGFPYPQSDDAFGTWSEITLADASDGYYLRSTQVGDAASYTFTGDWVGVGLIGGTASGIADIYIDGVLQESVDTYRLNTQAIGRYYDLITGTHTISVSVTGMANPNATSTRVNFDYFETWTGNPLPAGDFDQADERVFAGTGWNQIGGAYSGGTYWRDGQTLWFPFTGESVSYTAVARTLGDKVRAFVDGELVGTLDLYATSTQTRTFAFDGFTPGELHMLQLSAYRGSATADTFGTPGSPPFFDDTPAPGVVRHEEDHPAVRFNGDPYVQAPTSWFDITSSLASAQHYMRSNVTGDTVSLTFDGEWVGLGFVGGTNSGIVEIFVDGVSRATVDNYRRDSTSIYYAIGGLTPGTHTISVTVTGLQNPFANNTRLNFDYFDVWDGAVMATGTFTPTRGSEVAPYVTDGWTTRSNGGFEHLINGAGGSIWLPFTGDSVSFDTIAYSGGGEMDVFVDGEYITRLDLYNPVNERRTFSLDGLGAGPHVLQLRQYRGNASVESFTTPGSGPFYTPPPAPTGIIHYDEDSPQIRYNGAPLTATSGSWIDSFWNEAIDGQVIRSETLSDTISLDFYGSWAVVGMMSWSGGGLAEVFIDGVSQGIVDGYSSQNDVITLVYDGLTLDNHTLEIVVLDDRNPLSSGDRIYLDYIAAWDGTPEADGWYDFDRVDRNDNVSFTDNWSPLDDALAREGRYWRDGVNTWFRYTGDAFTLRTFTDQNTNAAVEVFVDGVSQGIYSTYYRQSNSPLPLHFSGLGAGPHIVRVENVSVNNTARADIDAFEANPVTLDPGVPMVEWEEFAVTGPILNAAMAGDIDEDGVVEIVVTDNQGNLFIYRGDGLEATGPQAVAGTPIEFTVDLGGEPDSVALADLDGVDGAEIAVGHPEGFSVYHYSGGLWAQQWFTNTVRSAWRAPSVGNIDDDPEPEIVTTANDCICILEGDGSGLTVIDQSADPIYPNFTNPLPPNLADLTGDGRLDILTGDGDTFYVFDTSTSPPSIFWSQSYTDTIDGRGTPGIADMDGHLPGGDDGPEIAFVSQQHIYLVEGDSGDVIWRYPTGGGAPGGTSIADLTGDGIPEVVSTAQVDGGRVFVLDAEGNLLWSQEAIDFSSANSVSVLDLDGDGVWEIAWNGDTTGFTIWRGSDGAVLFNEPLIDSTTRMDFPIIADVDLDGSAEVVTGDNDGIYIIGWDPVWAGSRPLWNQYNYHITNVNDDLSIPLAELNSWEVHNTYRTQTPLDTVLPVYDVVVTHTVPLSGVAVVTPTATLAFTSADNPYVWEYEQAYYQPERFNRFDVVLSDMAPGETRQVSLGTEIRYKLPSGENSVTLPPLYVTAARLIALSPFSQTVGAGATAAYTVTVINPSDGPVTYDLSLTALATSAVLPTSVLVPAGSSVDVALTFTTTEALLGTFDFAVLLDGGLDSANGRLTVVDAFDMSLAPSPQSAAPGQSRAYSLTVSNKLAAPQTIALSADGLPAVDVPPTVDLPGGGEATVVVTATGYAAGPLPFTVSGVSGAGATDAADGVLDVTAGQGVALALDPNPAFGGPGMPTVVSVTVTNTGDRTGTFDLTVDPPAGWSAELAQSSVTLQADVFDSAVVQLVLTPPPGTAAGSYPYAVSATGQAAINADQPASATVGGTVNVGSAGVQIELDPVSRTALPTDTPLWNVTVTNTGDVANTFVLSATGLIGLGSAFTQASVTLDAGASTTVQLQANDLTFALPGIVPFAVYATAAGDAAVQDEAPGTVTFLAQEGVAVSLAPATQTVAIDETAYYLLTITNTGGIVTAYDLSLVGLPQVASTPTVGLSRDRVTLPARTTAQVLVSVAAPVGVYELTATAASAAGTSAEATAVLQVFGPTAVDAATVSVTGAPTAPLMLTLLGVLLLLSGVLFQRRRVTIGRRE